jgi:hypothetical protein
MKRQKQQAGKTLADFDRPTRAALICEVLETLLDVNWMAGDHLDEENVRALAARFDVPFAVLHVGLGGSAQVTADDMREWCAWERSGKAVA